jgi:hypothetical protein
MVDQVEHKVDDISPTASIRLEFFDALGNPLSGMKVKVKPQDGEHQLEVDDDGKVELDGDGKGEVEIQVVSEAE